MANLRKKYATLIRNGELSKIIWKINFKMNEQVARGQAVRGELETSELNKKQKYKAHREEIFKDFN